MALEDPRPGFLRPYGLALGDEVEVEVLAPAAAGDVGPRLIEGRVVDATRAVVVIESTGLPRRTRVPWGAVALIRDRVKAPSHPAL